MCSEGKDIAVGSALQFLNLPVIPEVKDEEDEEDVLLDLESEPEAPGPDKPLLEQVFKKEKERTYPKVKCK